MSDRLKVIVNGKPYEVEIFDLGSSPFNVTVNGTAYTVSVELDEVSSVQKRAAPVTAPAMTPQQVIVESPAPLRVTAPAHTNGSNDAVTAPMPGVILDICVKVGETVKRGQQLCALEAMKMKSAIRSPRDGVIAAIEVTEGQRVAHGQVIVRFA